MHKAFERYSREEPLLGVAFTIERARCGRSAGIRCALLCFVVPVAAGVRWQVVESKGYLERSGRLIMPGSRVRVPPFHQYNQRVGRLLDQKSGRDARLQVHSNSNRKHLGAKSPMGRVP